MLQSSTKIRRISMRFPAPALLLVLLVLTTSTNAEVKLGWAHDDSDLSPDSRVVFGNLANGFRYAILPHTEPPRRVSLRLWVETGSLMEEEDQRGLAHFLEHLAFNGTRNFPGNELDLYLQRMGMAVGADSNASTSFDRTLYMLELPENSEDFLREGLKVMRDYSDGMLLDAEEIDKERGVILSEKRARDSAGYRTFVAELSFVLSATLIPDRLPIGSETVVENAGRDRFLDFYRDWYSSDRLGLVVVGDVDSETLIPLIEKHFATLKPVAQRRPDPDLGTIQHPGLAAMLHTEAEAPATAVSIQTVREYRKIPDSKAKREDMLYREVAMAALNRRLEILAKQEGAPFIRGMAYSHEFMRFVENAGIELSCRPEQWVDALTTAEQELRRALQFGFTALEIAEVEANTLNSYEQAVKTAATRKSASLANELAATIAEQIVFTHPEDDFAWVRSLLENLSPDRCLRAIRDAWKTQDIYLFVSGNLNLEDAENSLIEVYRKSRSVALEPPHEIEQAAFAYTDFGAPGKVIERRLHDDLGIHQVRFANQVALNLKQTDFEADTIRILIRVGAGGLACPENMPGLPLLASSTFSAGGLKAHSADDLARIFAGKNVGVQFDVESDAFVLSGRTTPDDLVHQMNLMNAFILYPGYRAESLRQAHKQFESVYLQIKHTPQGVMRDKVAKFFASTDFRFGYPEKEALMSHSLADVREWLTAHLEEGNMEVSVVGDIDVESTLAQVARTFGTLAPRRARKADYAERRRVKFPKGPASKTFAYETEIPKSVVVVAWPTDDIWNISRTRRLSMLAEIFSDRLRVKIREELGEAYSPYAVSRASDTFSGYGYLFGLVLANPEEAFRLTSLVSELGHELSRGGIDEDELDRALKPMLSNLKEYVRSNGYWVNTVLGSSQEYPQRLDWARTMEDDYASITVEDVNRIAAQFLQSEIQVNVLVTPETFVDDAASGS